MDGRTIPRGVLERAQRGIDCWRRGAVGWTGDGWVVAGDHGVLYVVDLEDEEGESCTCKDASVRGETCKHIFASVVERAKTSANGRR